MSGISNCFEYQGRDQLLQLLHSPECLSPGPFNRKLCIEWNQFGKPVRLMSGQIEMAKVESRVYGK